MRASRPPWPAGGGDDGGLSIGVLAEGTGLRLTGIVMTMFDPRNNLSHQVAAEARKNLNSHLFHTVIPRNVRLSESPSFGRPAILYAVSSSGAQAYLELAREMVNRWSESTNR